MIPKIIHYCWFGSSPLPHLAKNCIASWERFFPDYEIKKWDENNFDVDSIPYTHEAYEEKKYAFVSDYARFKILYEHGGIYFDTDVEVIKPMDDIILRGPFMGCEQGANTNTNSLPQVAPGLGLGVNPGLRLYKEFIDLYSNLHFRTHSGKLNLKTVVEYATELLAQHGLKDTCEIQQVAEVYIYPKEYFNPREHVKDLNITPNTRSIHHYAGSWLPASERIKKHLLKMIGKKNWMIIKRALDRKC